MFAMDYFPFFFGGDDFFAAGFFAAVFFAAVFFFAVVFFAAGAFFATTFFFFFGAASSPVPAFPAFLTVFRVGLLSMGFSASGDISSPIAALSITTTSDQRML
jgi:hypothetical protein